MSIQRISLACLLTVAVSVTAQAVADGPKMTVDPSHSVPYGYAGTHFGYHAPVYPVPQAVAIRMGVTGDFRNHFQNRIDRIQFGTTYYRDNSFTPMYRHPDRIRYLTRTREERNWRSRPHRTGAQATAVAVNPQPGNPQPGNLQPSDPQALVATNQ